MNLESFGDKDRYPSCECYSWNDKLFPCKHMLAVIHYGICKWEDLSPLFRESRYINLDRHVVNSSTLSEPFQIRSICNVDTVDYNTDNINTDNICQMLSEIPKPVYAEVKVSYLGMC